MAGDELDNVQWWSAKRRPAPVGSADPKILAIRMEYQYCAALATVAVVLLAGCASRPYKAIDLSNVDQGQGGFVVQSRPAKVPFAYRATGIGDINQDGYDDIALSDIHDGVPGMERAGITYVLFGRTVNQSLDLDAIVFPSKAIGFRLVGQEDNEYSGREIAGLGDFNGDGHSDIVVGAPGARNHAGRAYLVFGRNRTQEIRLSRRPVWGRGMIPVSGLQRYGEFGGALSAAGDVNGDGYDDALIAAYQNDPSGEAYVLFGDRKERRYDLNRIKDGTGPGFVILGETPQGQLGLGVSAGDINGDGYDDLIVSDRLASPLGRQQAGTVYVVFGKQDAAPVDVRDFSAGGEGGFAIYGPQPKSRVGRFVDASGDVNGDGLNDIAIGSSHTESNGDSYMVFGNVNHRPVDLVNLASDDAGFVIRGDETGDHFGRIACAGDLNNDGKDDLLLAESRPARGGRAPARKVYVLFGKDNHETVYLDELDAGSHLGTVVLASEAHTTIGVAVSTAGDINGDNTADFLISARVKRPNWERWGGGLYVIYGGEYLERESMRHRVINFLQRLYRRYEKGASSLTVRESDNE